MKLQDLFLIEQKHQYDLAEEFVIRCWGKLLYIDYMSLPDGRDMSESEDFIDLAEEFLYATHKNDEDKLEELDEWISEGAPLTDGRKLMSKTTVDVVLSGCQKAVDKELTLYRFNHTQSKLKPSSWLSLTTNPKGPYAGERTTYVLPVGTKVIDTLGLADDGEFIVRTDELIKLSGE